MKSEPSDSFKSPEKSSIAMRSQPSDQICSRTPKKLPHPPQRIKYHRHSLPLPEKYEILLRFFDALDASLKLLRLRKTIPLFNKIRVMIETMSERRFTHQHLAQLKFLLPEIGIKRVLMADKETRCMKYDLHITMTLAERRKKGSKHSCLRDRIISQLMEFARDHPEESEVPEEELPEPFNQQKRSLPSKTFKQSSTCSHMYKYSGVDVEPETAQASHFPPSFRKHFSKGGAVSESSNSGSVSTHQSPSIYVLNSSTDRIVSRFGGTTSLPPEMTPCRPSADQSKLKPFEDGETAGQIKRISIVDEITAGQIKSNVHVDGETCCAQNVKRKQGTPIKSFGTPFKPVTPSLRTPKKFRLSVDDGSASSECETSNRPSCARLLQFGSISKSVNIELQIEDDECSNIASIIPENLLQSLKEKEKKAVEMVKRKQVIKNLPKLFDRIYILFQNPKYSAIRKEALIRDLTECHSDITDENEVKEQFKLLQEIIPEWISCKLSPSGNTLYSINKALDPNMLRLTLNKAT